MPMVSKSTPSTKPATEKTCAIKRCRIYQWLRLKLFACLQKLSACLQKLWQSRPHPLAYIQRQWHTIALVTLYIFFRPTFESKLVALLQSFDPSWESFIVWCGIIVTVLAYTYVLCRRRYVISGGVRSWTAVLLVGWACYRLIGVANYVATPTPISGICYVDLLPILGSCVILVMGWSHWKRTKPKQEGVHNSRLGYEVECPCTAEDEDLLGRRKEAQDLAEKIFQTNTSNAAFTLGLTAPWGAGKTSFMLAMKDYLEKRHSDKTILLDFNPWMYRKAPNLTQVFFEELSRTLAPYSSALASGFTRYVDHILDKDDSAWLQLGARLLPQGFKAKSTSEQYEFLKKEICKLRRKIVIFIDDVDRLDGEELIELFSLIRNSSLSFPHMSYILAYDKEYVASQLQSKFNEHTYRYMEKILQEEYPLAKITPEQLEEALRLELKRIGYGDLWRDIKNSGLQLSYHLPTLRVIKRICNTLSSRRKELEGNVALFDWLIIELIRIQYPRVFDLLRVNYKRIFKIGGDRYVVDILGKGEEQNSSATAPLPDHPLYGGIIHPSRYLSEHQDSLQIKNVGLVIELIGLIWGTTRKVAPLQANHSDYIERYFYGTLRECEIDETEFREHVNLSFEEIKAYIQQKRASQITDLIQKVRREPAESQEKAQILLQILLYLFSDPSRPFRINQVMEKVDSLKEFLKEDNLKPVFTEIFTHPDTRLGVIFTLLHSDSAGQGLSFITQEEIETIKRQLFLYYVEESKPINPTLCYTVWRYIQTDSVGKLKVMHAGPSNLIAYYNKIDLKMKEIIEEHIGDLIPHLLEQESREERKYKLLPNPIWTLSISKGQLLTDAFLALLHRSNQAPSAINEFLTFLEGWLRHIKQMKVDLKGDATYEYSIALLDGKNQEKLLTWKRKEKELDQKEKEIEQRLAQQRVVNRQKYTTLLRRYEHKLRRILLSHSPKLSLNLLQKELKLYQNSVDRGANPIHQLRSWKTKNHLRWLNKKAKLLHRLRHSDRVRQQQRLNGMKIPNSILVEESPLLIYLLQKDSSSLYLLEAYQKELLRLQKKEEELNLLHQNEMDKLAQERWENDQLLFNSSLAYTPFEFSHIRPANVHWS